MLQQMEDLSLSHSNFAFQLHRYLEIITVFKKVVLGVQILHQLLHRQFSFHPNTERIEYAWLSLPNDVQHTDTHILISIVLIAHSRFCPADGQSNYNTKKRQKLSIILLAT